MAGPNIESMLFTTERAARIVGMEESRLVRWVRSDLYQPVREHFFDFRDLVALRVLTVLRDRGVPAASLRKLGRWLRDRHDRPWSELRFYSGGRSVYFDDPKTKKLVGHSPPGNLAFREVVQFDLDPVRNTVREAAAKINRRSPGKVERTRGVQGAPVVAGTRIPARTIRELRAEGLSTREILREFPGLKASDVDAALAHSAA